MSYKRKTLEERLEIIKQFESGKSPGYLHIQYHVNAIDLAYYKRRYDKYGIEGLKKTHVNYSGKFRQRVVRDVMEKGLSLDRASVKYDLCPSTIASWCKIARRSGMDALLVFYKQGRPPKDKKMGRPRKKKLEEMTELERLRYENEYLKAENALLKKVKALVEEREARQRATGLKSSKD